MNYEPRPAHRFDLRLLTSAQLVRLYGRVWDRMTAGDGYQPFGYDVPTLWLTHPGWMVVLTSINNELLRRVHA